MILLKMELEEASSKNIDRNAVQQAYSKIEIGSWGEDCMKTRWFKITMI